MNRSFTRWAALASAAAILACTSIVAFAQASFTLNDPNCSDFTLGGSVGSRTLTCVPISGPPTNPPSCTISGPSTGTIGTPITLTANCGPGPITVGSYVWTGGNCAGISLGTCNTSGPASSGQVQYTVLAANVNGAGSASPAKSVTWSTGGGGGGGGGGGALSCSGFAKTVVIDENFSATSFPRKYTQDAGGFQGNDALIIRFTTGSLTAPGKSAAITLAEYGSPPSARHATLSATPCDFGAGMQPPVSEVMSNTVRVIYQVGGTPVDYPALSPNTTYYLNIINVSPSSCQSGGVCDMFVDFTKPRGL